MIATVEKTFPLVIGALLLLVTQEGKSQEQISDYYAIENIALPERVDGETGGLTFLPDGRLAACFHQGDIYLYDPSASTWEKFAEGLHEPLGLYAVSNTELIVMQRPELTRIVDTDGDGWADRYETISDDFGMSGNYHEFAYGPAVDDEGNFYISLNCASNGAGIYDEVRGEFRENGRPGRMYSCVPYRGWVLKITPEGEMIPWASGFRSPNGIGFNATGDLFVSDNQGDWLGTSKLFHVERGNFYGHVTSLVWQKGFEGNPLEIPLKELDEMRTKAAILFPHGMLANSPTQPLVDSTGGRFGPFADQLLIGEMNHPRLIRIMLDEVGGALQGAAVPFFEGDDLQSGNNRLQFGPNDDLWIAHTARRSGWAGDRGIQRLRWKGETPLDVLQMHLTQDGFELTFTRPIDPASVEGTSNVEAQHYYYEYHRSYGSDRYDEQSVNVRSLSLSDDHRRLRFALETLKPGYVYQIQLAGLTAKDGKPIIDHPIYYTLNRLIDGTTATPQFAPKDPTPFSALRDGRIEAESAQVLQQATTADSNPGFSGTGYVDFQTSAQDVVEWVVTEIPDDVSRIRLAYALDGSPRPLRLTVNGDVVDEALLLPPTGSWEKWSIREVTVPLKPGKNQLRLESQGASGPNIDFLELIRSGR